jgi:hypothetical protein
MRLLMEVMMARSYAETMGPDLSKAGEGALGQHADRPRDED